MANANNLTIYTGQNAANVIIVQSPALLIYDSISPSSSVSDINSTTQQPQVVQPRAQTFIFKPGNIDYFQAIYSFNLKSALLDSAPTQGVNQTPLIFTITIALNQGGVTIKDGTSYVIDAQIQTIGNSAMAPTYVTPAFNSKIVFPVTNFFNVSSPGAPYTITITGTRVTANSVLL